MSNLLQVLIVEDSECDAAMLVRALSKAGYDVQVERVEDAAQMQAALARQPWDVVISDYSLPQFDAPAALALLQQSRLDIPFIVVSGTMGEEVAVKMMKAGAHDYLMKDKLVRLAPAVARELREAKARQERRQTEEALKALTERLSSIFRAAPIGIGVAVNRVIKEVNECMLEITGYSRAELIEQSACILYTDDAEFERVGREKYVQLREGGTSSIETKWQRKDGSIRDILLCSTPLNPDDGSVGITFTALDITARKQAETALIKSTNDYRLLSEFNQQLNDIFISFNEAASLDDLNRIIAESYRRLTGAAAVTVACYDSSSQTLQIVTAAMDEEMLARIETLLGVSLFEMTMTIPDGMVPTMINQTIRKTTDLTALSFGRISPETAGSLMAAMGCNQIIALALNYGSELLGTALAYLPTAFTDLADNGFKTFAYLAGLALTRKKAEESLRQSKDRYRTVADYTYDWEYWVGPDEQWLYCSPSCERITGYPAQCFLGNPDFLGEIIHPDDRLIMALHQAKPGDTAQGENIDFRIIHRNGAVHWISHICQPVWGQDGQWQGRRASNRDITERKKLEAANEQLAAQFYQAQKIESIGRLAGGIAHDFNNLLVPIVGYTELGMLNLNPDSQLYTDLKRIREAGQRAASLTRQILAFSRQQILEMKSLDLNHVISEFEPMLRRLIGEDIDLQLHLAANLPCLKADKGQLEQVLLNLAVNARDAMPNGGLLVIETAQVMLDAAYVAKHTGAQPGPHARLAVSDTGYGMDAAIQQRIFEPFFTTKALGQGTGLGLSTVFGIVKQHGGNIWVYSELGQGTSFKIYLPLTEAPASTAEPEYPESDLLDGTETVLLVEDEASVRQLVGDTLRTYGYQVLEAGEPEKGLALAAAHQNPIHLLVTDVIMPKMRGPEAAKRLTVLHPETKVLYMSGYTDQTIARHGVMESGQFFLQKPFSPYALVQKVREILDSSSF